MILLKGFNRKDEVDRLPNDIFTSVVGEDLNLLILRSSNDTMFLWIFVVDSEQGITWNSTSL